MDKTNFSLSEVASHDSENDCWITIDGKVYDVTSFLPSHPGGKKVILKLAGKDATEQFKKFHDPIEVLNKYGKQLQIGALDNKETTKSDSNEKFGSPIPFAEPAWYRGFETPYYNDSHRRLRAKIRNFIETEIVPNVPTWEEQKDYPRELHQIAYKAGVYGINWPIEYGGTPPEDYDIFHELVYWDEIARCSSGGITAAVFFTIAIALPPVLLEGPEEMKQKIAREVITGQKIIALAVTEPSAGSDVANIETTAVRDAEYYIVNGAKKFITSGMKGDYFVTAVRTGTRGMGGVSLLLIESHRPGIKLTRLPTQGWVSSNTALIVFEDVRVPVSNLIGVENQGFRAIMFNFNHERWTGVALSIRACRVCIEEAVKYARQRKTFGKRLIDNQVIRHKISEMGTRVELAQNMLENLCYQIKCGTSPLQVGGHIAALKVFVSRSMEYCAREASQILGGNSYLRSGVGAKVERIYREVRVAAIGGGSEEVMTDLAMKLANL